MKMTVTTFESAAAGAAHPFVTQFKSLGHKGKILLVGTAGNITFVELQFDQSQKARDFREFLGTLGVVEKAAELKIDPSYERSEFYLILPVSALKTDILAELARQNLDAAYAMLIEATRNLTPNKNASGPIRDGATALFTHPVNKKGSANFFQVLQHIADGELPVETRDGFEIVSVPLHSLNPRNMKYYISQAPAPSAQP